MKVTELVAQIAQPIVEEKGCKLWDVEYVREGSERFLRVYIDKEGGFTVDDCELFFNGDWFKMLTKLDGPELMEEIKSDLDCGRSHLPDLWR